MMGLPSPSDVHTKPNGTTLSMEERGFERKTAKLFRPIVSLQRAWKTYVRGEDELFPVGSHSTQSSDGESTSDYIPSISLTPPEDDQDLESEDSVELENGTNTSVPRGSNNTGMNIGELESHHLPAPSRPGDDSETESVVSDYSEMADPVKEHLANVQIVCCADTKFIVREKVLRGVGESEEEFIRRLRKTNLLSLAQEFADLKRANESALPFDLHEKRYSERVENESDTDEIEGISGDSRSSTADVSLSTEGGYDSGWQDETPLQREAYHRDREDFPETISGNVYECSTANSLLVSKSRNGVDFDEDRRFKAEERCLEDVVSTADEVGKSTQLFSTVERHIPNVVFDQPPTLHRGIEFSLSYHSGSIAGFKESKITEDLDDCTIEKVFPLWDWKGLDDELKRADEAERERSLPPASGCRGDREEILQRLAMLDEEEEEWYGRGSERSHMVDPLNMDMCYLNEEADDLDPDNGEPSESSRQVAGLTLDRTVEGATEPTVSTSSDDLLARQATLKAQATIALAQVRPMVPLPSKADTTLQERLATEIVQIVNVSKKEKTSTHISRQTLDRMSFAQLQIFANDLHTQIEVLNIDLMLGLVERDDLHMIQDSMLVDIEDLTGRAREFASKVDSRQSERLLPKKFL